MKSQTVQKAIRRDSELRYTYNTHHLKADPPCFIVSDCYLMCFGFGFICYFLFIRYAVYTFVLLLLFGSQFLCRASIYSKQIGKTETAFLVYAFNATHTSFIVIFNLLSEYGNNTFVIVRIMI